MRYGRRNRYPGNGPYSDIPPYERPGYLYGGGRGRGFAGTDPTKCARFPWMPRWWWANPDIENPTVPQIPQAVPESEKEFLETQLGYLAKEIEQIRSRLEEINKTETQ